MPAERKILPSIESRRCTYIPSSQLVDIFIYIFIYTSFGWMGMPSFLPGGLTAALPCSCFSAVFAQSVGGAGYSVVKVQLGGFDPLVYP
jgi:hypothetical protein